MNQEFMDLLRMLQGQTPVTGAGMPLPMPQGLPGQNYGQPMPQPIQVGRYNGADAAMAELEAAKRRAYQPAPFVPEDVPDPVSKRREVVTTILGALANGMKAYAGMPTDNNAMQLLEERRRTRAETIKRNREGQARYEADKQKADAAVTAETLMERIKRQAEIDTEARQRQQAVFDQAAKADMGLREIQLRGEMDLASDKERARAQRELEGFKAGNDMNLERLRQAGRGNDGAGKVDEARSKEIAAAKQFALKQVEDTLTANGDMERARIRIEALLDASGMPNEDQADVLSYFDRTLTRFVPPPPAPAPTGPKTLDALTNAEVLSLMSPQDQAIYNDPSTRGFDKAEMMRRFRRRLAGVGPGGSGAAKR